MQKDAKELAIKRAIDNLKEKEINKHCESFGFVVDESGLIHFKYFGKDTVFNLKEFSLTNKYGSDISLNEQVLFYHYLLNESIPVNTGKFISFREIPTGQFYNKPFQERTINILSSRVGNDLDRLEKNLNMNFDWEKIEIGDFAAKIPIVRSVYIILIYYLGDNEFESTAQVLFDESIKHIFSPEDIVVLTSLVCLKLSA